MKHLNIVLLVLLCLSFSQVKSQQNMFLTSDKPAKCQNIKTGKFVRIDAPIDEWVMVVQDNVQTEYYNNGKDYVKSRLDFVDDCSYKVTIIAKSNEDYPVKLGEVMVNRILETDRNFIKLTSEYNNKTSEFILSKVVEEPQ
ncbi:hypothetical protein CEY12_04885 [Chryseobacterium sp. T16E-39]|uniref:hypothetical protein n=1 Tax=Chryseobacterium sp. T16E-39 TaxID=2015076 RepID=UPI000B5B3FA7|nr:hypothetical protein [Chryseobacterium sp. T16E-39]ASK29479.1 hypothetical protein CEY12_04885 [Chryseobacterium sp. T16E-39]